MDLKLDGKRALVTGSTAGIGKAIAAALAAEGATVIVNGRTAERVDAAKAEVGGAVEGIVADLSTGTGVQATIDAALAGGDVDILVNNFGIYETAEFGAITDEDWMGIFEKNVLSGIRLARALTPAMVERGWGRVLFISSESGINIPTEMVHYGVTKAAQLAVSRGLAKTLKGSGVTVNCLLPGPTMTEGVIGFIDRFAKETGKTQSEFKDDFFTNARPGSLIQRFADPIEVGHHAAFLCSPLADATTGAAHRVEGGIVDTIV